MAEGKARAKDTRVICVRTDLPQNQRKPIQDAIRSLFHKIVQKDDRKQGLHARWGEFAKVLKASLDKNFEPHWHVVVGKEVGFACKKRDRTMGMWRIGESLVVIWQSPGLEGPPSSPGAASSNAEPSESQAADTAESKAADNADASGQEGAAQATGDAPASAEPRAAKGVAAATLRVVRPTDVEAGSEVEQTIALIREEFAGATTDDVEVLAQSVRRRLMSELGPIWHVITGAEFNVEAAVDCRNFVLATAGKLRIACFQHEQWQESRIDWEKIFKALPYLLVIIFGFAYMTLNSVCQEAPRADNVLAWKIRNKFCREGWEQDLAFVGGCAMIGLYLSTKWKLFFPKPKG